MRIRPLAAEGGHAEDGTVLQKHLEAWDETSVTIETQYSFSKGEAKYAYPKKVFGTAATQTEVTDAMVPDLVASFADEGQSVLFFAYGQTGTGKTRTMLGTEPSLASATPHEDWGVFPRVWAATFEKMAALRQAGTKCVLTASALEFYLGECYDLLSSSERAGNAPVQIDFLSHLPSGESCVVLEQPSELLAFLAGDRQPLDARHQLQQGVGRALGLVALARRAHPHADDPRRRRATSRGARSPSSTSRAPSGPTRCTLRRRRRRRAGWSLRRSFCRRSSTRATAGSSRRRRWRS